MQGLELTLNKNLVEYRCQEKNRGRYSFLKSDGGKHSFAIELKHARKRIFATLITHQTIPITTFILLLTFSIFFLSSLSLRAEEAIPSLQNKGLLLIEKEMIRLSDYKQKWGKREKENYRALLFLEDYFLNQGMTPWSMKVLHKIISMRDNTLNLRKKAFLDCEAWRVLDHDLKNYENKTLLEELRAKRKYTKEDHRHFRDFSSDKVASCIGFIHPQWKWVGQEYKDVLYDVKAKNALQSVRTYLRVKEAFR